MCLICVEFQKNALTPNEAIRALREMKIAAKDVEHAKEVLDKILNSLPKSQQRRLKVQLND